MTKKQKIRLSSLVVLGVLLLFLIGWIYFCKIDLISMLKKPSVILILFVAVALTACIFCMNYKEKR